MGFGTKAMWNQKRVIFSTLNTTLNLGMAANRNSANDTNNDAAPANNNSSATDAYNRNGSSTATTNKNSRAAAASSC